MKNIAYYLWRFPVLSETFIQRELSALQEMSSFSVRVIADRPDALAGNDPQLQKFSKNTHYLLPANKALLLRRVAEYFCLRPWAILKLFIMLRTHRYQSTKSLREDIRIFLKTIYLAGELKDRDIDHLHAPWADVNSFVGMLAARLNKITFSLQARAHELHRHSSAFALKEKFTAAKFVITNTKYNIRHVKNCLQEKEWKKINQIYNGVPLETFRSLANSFQAIQEEAPLQQLPDSVFRILVVGRLIEQKGHHHILNACRKLADNGFQIQCDIIGGPELPLYEDYYKNLLHQHKYLELDNIVNFHGALSFQKVMEAYGKSDLFVLPCVLADDGSRDIIPNAVIEAMAMKLPVISTTVTGVPEIVDHGINGLLVPPADVDGLVKAISQLIKNANLRQQFGEAARKKVEKRFNIQNNIKSYVEVFGQ